MLATTHGPNFQVNEEGRSRGWPKDVDGWYVFFKSEYPEDPEFADALFTSFMQRHGEGVVEGLDFKVDRMISGLAPADFRMDVQL
jgi:hypothetical protein